MPAAAAFRSRAGPRRREDGAVAREARGRGRRQVHHLHRHGEGRNAGRGQRDGHGRDLRGRFLLGDCVGRHILRDGYRSAEGLKRQNLVGAIVGKALYEGRVKLKELKA